MELIILIGDHAFSGFNDSDLEEKYIEKKMYQANGQANGQAN